MPADISGARTWPLVALGLSLAVVLLLAWGLMQPPVDAEHACVEKAGSVKRSADGSIGCDYP